MHSDLEMKLLVPKFHVVKDVHLKMHTDLEMKLLGLICYRDVDHKVEWKQSGKETLHPALIYCLLLKFSLMKGCLEALHPHPFVWLVRKLVSNLVYLVDRSVVAVIKSNDCPELDFQQQVSG
jgi:hypothetical protein